ncbi:MAG: NAD(P)/FAD-dependent oxidoreductase [Bacteroidales bacterium]|nr:NAD(P)/FAD-dependent oxidoreductase [Bacteroidales bacterium]
MENNRILVIGGGLGGLMTAIILQKNNYDVTIVEKNSRAGGLLQSFKRKTCNFDTGMHYIGSLDKGQVMYKLFKYFEIFDMLNLKRMDADRYDVFKIGDKTYNYPFGWKAFKKQMLDYFPNEGEALEKYVRKVIEVSKSHDLYSLRYPIDESMTQSSYMEEGVDDFVKSITNNVELQNVLLATNPIYAGRQHKSSLYMHSVIHNYYNNSAYKVVGGGEEVAQSFVKVFTGLGGKIIVNEEIVKLDVKEKSVVGAISRSGQKYESDYFISNVHPSLTMKMVDDQFLRKSYKKRLLNQKNTISTFSLHIKLKKSVVPSMNYTFYRYLDNNIWSVDNYKPDTLPNEYIIYTPATNDSETMSKCISVLTYMSYDQVKQWEGTSHKSRPKDYLQWKQQMVDKILKVLEEDFPGIVGNIEHVEALSPLSYKDYVNNVAGEMYGIEHDFNNALYSKIFPKTKLKNLYLTGQNINMHGMLGVALASLLTVKDFVPINDLLKDINPENDIDIVQ